MSAATIETDTEITPVIFRVGREDGEIFALFPTMPGSCSNPYLCTAYDPQGGHCAANYNLSVQRSRPAFAKEADDLKKLLTVQYGYNLREYHRERPEHRRQLRENGKR